MSTEYKVNNLSNLTVLDEKKNPVQFSSFWQDQTAILIFIRHFG